MAVLIVPYLFLVGLVALLAQMILPIIFPGLSIVGFGSALVPLVVIYASLELGDERAPFLAGLLGLALDLTSFHRLGTSILILASISVLIITQAHKPAVHTWPFRIVFVLLGTFTFLLVDYLFILAETVRWYWPLDVWSKITFATLLDVMLCPLLFFLIGLPPRLCGWKPAHEVQERRYAG